VYVCTCACMDVICVNMYVHVYVVCVSMYVHECVRM